MQNIPDKIYSLSPVEVLNGYANGFFPMGDSKNTVDWYEADPRAILYIKNHGNNLIIPRSLKQVLKKNNYEIIIDTAFEEVIKKCSERDETWINKIIIDVYTELHKQGYAHSVEAWKNGKLAGGLYGVALRGAFFGESMFHIEPNASKICVVKLYELLKKNRYKLFDIQMLTPVFKSFGAILTSKADYHKELKEAMRVTRKFDY
ncbi:MAG: leucyl/phenylalanyl-tRNA--protein transferase [Ignavibacteriae bacterium]|nr:leucyl/phenylalanyl-tRNA--protein transferase [Ignavibacteriota bacterium]